MGCRPHYLHRFSFAQHYLLHRGFRQSPFCIEHGRLRCRQVATALSSVSGFLFYRQITLRRYRPLCCGIFVDRRFIDFFYVLLDAQNRGNPSEDTGWNCNGFRDMHESAPLADEQPLHARRNGSCVHASKSLFPCNLAPCLHRIFSRGDFARREALVSADIATGAVDTVVAGWRH